MFERGVVSLMNPNVAPKEQSSVSVKPSLEASSPKRSENWQIAFVDNEGEVFVHCWRVLGSIFAR
jgi:hypothetical protein